MSGLPVYATLGGLVWLESQAHLRVLHNLQSQRICLRLAKLWEGLAFVTRKAIFVWQVTGCALKERRVSTDRAPPIVIGEVHGTLTGMWS